MCHAHDYPPSPPECPPSKNNSRPNGPWQFISDFGLSGSGAAGHSPEFGVKIIRALTDIHEKIVCLCSFSLSSSLFFFSLLLLSSFSSLLFSSLAFLSCLVFSCLVLSLFLCLSLFLSPCCVMWCVSLWWWCRCVMWCVVLLVVVVCVWCVAAR